MSRTYVNETTSAEVAVSDIVRFVETGIVRPLVSIDVETAPIAALVGYPGTVQLEGGKFERATKDAYLKFAQYIWKGSFNPARLRNLGLYLPMKTTAGQENGVKAQDAWSDFLSRLNELEHTEESRAQLEDARWDAESLKTVIDQYREELVALREEKEQAENELHTLQVEGITKGKRTWESQLKKANNRIEVLEVELSILTGYAMERLTDPLDLRLLTHVVRVGVEKRIHLNAEGRNRIDPVQPGLDPNTSDLFLVQITLQDENTRELYSYIFNIFKVPVETLLPVLRLDTKFIGHNIVFDLQHLMHKLGHKSAPRNVHCTMLGSRMLYLGLDMPHNLLHVAKRFTGKSIDKALQTSFVGRRVPEPTEGQLEYAYTDTEILFPIYDKQMAKAAKTRQTSLLDVFSRLSWITAYWQLRGFTIDEQKWLSIAAEAAQARDQLAAELEVMLLPEGYERTFSVEMLPVMSGGLQMAEQLENDTLDEHLRVAVDAYNTLPKDDDDEDATLDDARKDAIIRISQTQAVARRLEEVLEMDLGQFSKTGKPSLEKTARGAAERAYRNAHDGQAHPFFHTYGLWSKRAKQASTYGKRFLWAVHPLTGAIHPSLRIAGTDTARYASTNPNILNIPAAKEEGDPDFRSAFVAPEGYYLLGADFDSMELFIAGNLGRDEMVKRMKESGADPHGFTAAQMFHIEQTHVSEPRAKTLERRRGTMKYDITVFEVPMDWTAERVADFALSPEVQAEVKRIKNQYKDASTRTDAKSVTFLWLFQGTAYTLASREGLPVETTEGFFVRFGEVYKGMDGYMKKLAVDAITKNIIEGEDGKVYAYSEGYNGIRRYVEMPKGYSRHVFESVDAWQLAKKEFKRQVKRCQRELCNLPEQGGNAVITAEALLQMVEMGWNEDILPFLSIYDEIIAQAPDEVPVERVKYIIETSMLENANKYMDFIPAGAEADINKAGKYWRKS